MPAAVPDRFKLEIRLGRDGDLEEWLATDTSLDRPVLVRSLGPESTPERRKEFVAAVSAAATVAHQHLARVFAVDEVEGGAYSISEWTGGSTLEDRIAADHPIELPDFLPNAAGLSGALAALHETGAAHGAIDVSAVSYSSAHAAKLGAFGRTPRTDSSGDVRALSAALESALTGSPPGGPPPSERIDGIPRTIDRVLRAGQSGSLDADSLQKAFLAAPTPRAPAPEPASASRKLLVVALVLVALAVGLVALGRVFSGSGEPIIPTPPTTTSLPELGTTTAPPPAAAPGQVAIENAASFDPFGEGGENDDTIGNLHDNDFSTAWRTERYRDPLPLLKEGVGVTFTVTGSPTRVQLAGFTPGTVFEIYWSDTFFPQPKDWTRVAGAVAPPGAAFVDLPTRQEGFWLLWLTDLPLHTDGMFYSSISEVRFLP
ncbi:MAG: hypothetical protein U9N56_04705 [Actinomycetota bacterium]|nr:hypothetical protein [Actinomycetota bacterium]